MSARRTERLLNLVLALLSTRRFLTFEQIRAAVPGYEDADPESARRKFERDKAEIRDLGIPLETVTDPLFEDEQGYRIARRDYELPDIELAPDEAAAVGLAARLWAQAGLAGDASRALVKLRAAGIPVDGPQLPGLEPRVEAGEAAFEPLLAAVTARRPVAFDYRGPASPAPAARRVEPWGVVSWHGSWYLVGHDRDRADSRVFRLSRVTSAVRPIGPDGSVQVPAGIDLRGAVRARSGGPAGRARLRIRPGAAFDLRRRAGADSAAEVVDLPAADLESLADEIAGHGSTVVVLDPPALRDAVVDRLRRAAGVR